MRIVFGPGKHQSLVGPFEWDVPSFAVLTGANGSGKSQLLLAIRQVLSGNHAGTLGLMTIDGIAVSHNSNDIALVTDDIQVNAQPINQLVREQAVNLIRTNSNVPPHHSSHITSLREKLIARFGPDLSALRTEQILEHLNVYDLILPGTSTPDTFRVIGTAFYEYFVRKLESLNRGASPAEIEQRLGPAPWRIANDLFEGMTFRHKFSEPVHLVSEYRPTFVDKVTGDVVEIGNLSSGERAIALLIARIYASNTHSFVPKVILLDEPDAHLHPDITKAFITQIKKQFVDKHGCTVVMTTHRPDTISYVTPGSLFELRRTDAATQVLPITKDRAVAELSGYSVAVVSDRRIIFVEDQDDQDFYSTACGIAKRHGLVPESPELLFQRVSIGEGSAKISGGKNKVRSVVSAFNQHGLGSIIRGLIDRDDGNAATDGVAVLNRYSIENYLLDPLVIFFTGIEVGAEFSDDLNGRFRRGDEHKLRGATAAVKQEIADLIFRELESSNDPLFSDRAAVSVKFGQETISYRMWLKSARGKDLLVKARARYQFIEHRFLADTFERLQLVPSDLLDCFAKVRSVP